MLIDPEPGCLKDLEDRKRGSGSHELVPREVREQVQKQGQRVATLDNQSYQLPVSVKLIDFLTI